MTNIIDGKTFFAWFSPDDGATFYKAVCLTSQKYDASRKETVTPTQCEDLKARSTPDRKIQIDVVMKTNPAAIVAGKGEVSYKLFQQWFEADQSLLFNRETPEDDGGDFFQQGNGHIVSLSDTTASDDKMLCTVNFSFDDFQIVPNP